MDMPDKATISEKYSVTINRTDGEDQVIEMHPIKHSTMRAIRRAPVVVGLVVDITTLKERIESLPEDNEERMKLFIQQMTLITSLLEESAVIAIETQHPGLIDSMPFEDTSVLIRGVVDADIKECFGMGEALETLNQMGQEGSESTKTSSTDSSSTTSVENSDGQTNKS